MEMVELQETLARAGNRGFKYQDKELELHPEKTSKYVKGDI